MSTLISSDKAWGETENGSRAVSYPMVEINLRQTPHSLIDDLSMRGYQ